MSGELELDRAARTGAAVAGRQTLSRERIIMTALDVVDKHGVTAVTMRRLGKELGVEAMSLYRYVNGREDLLEGIVDHLVAQLHLRPDCEQRQPTDGWQAHLRWLAHGVRAIARNHPHVVPLIATRHPAAPWLRPPLRSPRVVEDLLAVLISRGFSDDHAVMAYRSFSSFLLGHLLLEGNLLGAQTSPTAEPLDDGESAVPDTDRHLNLDGFPHVKRLQTELSEDRSAAEFRQALEDLLDWLALLIVER